MNLNELDQILKKEPNYRKKQTLSLIYKNLINNWGQATNIPKELKEALNKKTSLKIKSKLYKSKNKNSFEASIISNDHLEIETVLMKHSNQRNTVCVSSQFGCPIKCRYCYSGKLKFKRNLQWFEILEQVLFWKKILKKNNQRVTNIVFIGMGEPLLNWSNVKEAINTINNPDCFDISIRSISISTSGLINEINKLAKEKLQINLTISLHASNNNLRNKLMPINEKNPIESLLKAANKYIKNTNRKLMIEYLLLKNVNDSKNDAKKLSILLKKHLKNLFFVNLIPYNQTDSSFQSSSLETIQKFKTTLEKNGIYTTQRYRFGNDINAACGQLSGRSKGSTQDYC